MRLLKELYKIYSPSGKEKRMRQFIKRYIINNIPTATFEVDNIGNIYITKGKAESYPCIVAHLDQVQRIHSRDFTAIETGDIIFGYSPKNRQQEGLGADDKNGIWVALKCLSKYDNLKVALFVQEEVGCVGSSQANMEFFGDCRFVIEPDRRGYKDLITTIGWTKLCSDEFIQETNPSRFGYKETEGAMTDVEILKENGLRVSCINLSCGYYEPHTDHEFTVKRDILNCLAFVESIIENCKNVYHHTEVIDRESNNDYNYFDQYEEVEMIVTELINIYPKIQVDEIQKEYGLMFNSLKKQDFTEILNSVNRQYFNY